VTLNKPKKKKADFWGNNLLVAGEVHYSTGGTGICGMLLCVFLKQVVPGRFFRRNEKFSYEREKNG
jgi:hypothetical protein